jgi:hypothetical protein
LGEVASSEIRDTLEKSATLGIPSTPPMFTWKPENEESYLQKNRWSLITPKSQSGLLKSPNALYCKSRWDPKF